MSEVLRPDLCVIGAGSGGLSVAAAAAAMGVQVVLVEKGEMGGDCLNYGCVPSKALIAAGRAAQTMREASRFGLHDHEPRLDMHDVHKHVRGVIDAIAPNDSEARFKAMGVRVIRAAGKFTGPDVLEAGGAEIRARRFVVATGSSPAVPPIPGIELTRFLTNETLFDLDVLPTRLAIIGAGPIGLEMAQAFRRLGSEVVVLEAGRALAKEDPELARPAIDALLREGVVIREGVSILRCEAATTRGCRIVLPAGHVEEFIDATHVLVATGRRPNVHNLGLEAAKVESTDKGVKVSANLRTTNRRIYAIGDVAGGPQFTHAANYHAGLVLRSALFRLPVKARDEAIPRVTYTDPEIAVAGLTETQAREQNHKLQILRWPFAENDRARAERRTEGLIKVVATPAGKILGAGIAGPHAGELIAPWQLAIAQGLKLKDMAGLILPYPTLSEVSRRAAILQYQPSLRRPGLGRLLRFMRLFG
ncbi:MAG: FAD-dependent oxidoreductase [Beijerinckiaceae bacterium]|nr:FAD-dependent oxidoreductase [Beijerinckiaceae bacterium]